MRVRQIGTIVFNADTNIVVDATNQDAPGIGFRANSLHDPQPFSVEIAFRRATRQQALDAVSALASELYGRAQRRQGGYFAIAGGAFVSIEDATGNASLWVYLRDAEVTLLSIETTTTGVIARVRVTGTLGNPFLGGQVATTLSSLSPYERRAVTLPNTSDAYLYKGGFSYSVSGMNGLYNALLAIENLESATATSRIIAINLTQTSSGINTNTWTVGGQTLTRATFSQATSGTIWYTVDTNFPHDVYRLFIEIFCPSTPSSNARYIVSWSGQPQIAETITGDRSWYTPALFVRSESSFTLTLEIQNVPTGTLVMPLILIPTDGVYVWNVITSPTLQRFQAQDPNRAITRPFDAEPPGIVYGAPGFVSGRHIVVFNGVMAPIITGAAATLNIFSRRIEPASFA